MTDRTCAYTSRIPFVRQLEQQPFIVGSAYRKLIPHLKGNLACVMDIIGDQPILSQRRVGHVSSYLI